MTYETPNERPLNVGVVGLGVAGRSHMRAYSAHPGTQLVAIAGMEDDLLNEYGDQFSVAALYKSWEALLEHSGLDAISVAIPNALHAPASRAALQANLHVLCEKPLARSADEAATVLWAARKHGSVLDVAFNKRGRPVVVALKQLVGAGLLGRIYYTKAYWRRRQGVPPLGSWLTSQDVAGGGALLDTGIHALDLALHVLGEPCPASVAATRFAELGPHDKGQRPVTLGAKRKQLIGTDFEVEDFASALIRFNDDTAVQLEASWGAHQEEGNHFGLELFGTQAGARLAIGMGDSSVDQLTVFGDIAGVPASADVPLPAPDAGTGGNHAAIVSTFIDRIRRRDLSENRHVDMLRRSTIVDACYSSANSAQEVPVPDSEELLAAVAPT